MYFNAGRKETSEAKFGGAMPAPSGQDAGSGRLVALEAVAGFVGRHDCGWGQGLAPVPGGQKGMVGTDN